MSKENSRNKFIINQQKIIINRQESNFDEINKSLAGVYRPPVFNHMSFSDVQCHLNIKYSTTPSYPSAPQHFTIFNQIAAAVKHSEINFNAPDALGWRCWNLRAWGLSSPVYHTPWRDNELRVNPDDIRKSNKEGIHALRMPVDWQHALWPLMQAGVLLTPHSIFGIVERFGKYILGEFGWRAEWVVIKELLADNERDAAFLRKLYPQVTVHIVDWDWWRGCFESEPEKSFESEPEKSKEGPNG